MAEIDPQLVQLIADQVLAALAQRGPAAQGGGDHPPAAITPPIGVCTGDYSKFPELAGKLYGQAETNQPQSNPSPRPALSGIVTASQLEEAMDAAPDGTAHLAHNARLTPLAQDLAKKLSQRIVRISEDGGADPSAAAPGWAFWMQGDCPASRRVMAQRGARPIAQRAEGSALPGVVRELADRIKAGSLRGALLFVPNAARAMCYANRCRSLRAVVATCDEAVQQGVNELGANVLVIEYPYTKPQQIERRVNMFLAQPPSVPALVERELTQLSDCK